MNESDFSIVVMQSIHFRPIELGDMEFNYRVYYSTREDELRKTGWSEEEKEAFARQQCALQFTQYSNYYAGATFEIISFASTPVGRLFLQETAREIRIMDIAILPEFRNRGIGTAILTSLIDSGKEKNKTVSIHVEIDNPALRLYERLGFTKSETRGLYYFMEFFASTKQ